MRLTRARAGIVKPSRAAQEANDEIELSSDNEDSEQEKEWAEESDDEAPRRGTRLWHCAPLFRLLFVTHWSGVLTE